MRIYKSQIALKRKACYISLMNTLYLPLIVLTISIQLHGFYIWSYDIENQRQVVVHDDRLQSAADYKAMLLLTTGDFNHCINGYCPNKMVKEFGCDTGFDDDRNDIESLIVGEKDFNAAYQILKNSPKHRTHLLAEDEFFKSQDMLAVGYAEFNNNYAYVFISAHCL